MYQQADHLNIPLLDGKCSVAQVSAIHGTLGLLLLTRRHREPGAPTPPSESAPISKAEIIARRVVDLSALAPDQWAIIGFHAIPKLPRFDPWPPNPDTTIDDPAVIEAFVNACLGLFPWDGFGDAAFFQNMLLDPTTRPAAARLAAQMPNDN